MPKIISKVPKNKLEIQKSHLFFLSKDKLNSPLRLSNQNIKLNPNKSTLKRGNYLTSTSKTLNNLKINSPSAKFIPKSRPN